MSAPTKTAEQLLLEERVKNEKLVQALESLAGEALHIIGQVTDRRPLVRAVERADKALGRTA